MQKAVSDFLFGLCFGLGFAISTAVLNLIASLIARIGEDDMINPIVLKNGVYVTWSDCLQMWVLADFVKSDENPELKLKQAAEAEAEKIKLEEQPKQAETWRDRAIKEPVFW